MAKNYGTDSLWGCLIVGVVTEAAGIVCAAIGLMEDVNLVFYIGSVVAAIGSTLLVIGCIGWGVLLGLRARDAER